MITPLLNLCNFPSISSVNSVKRSPPLFQRQLNQQPKSILEQESNYDSTPICRLSSAFCPARANGCIRAAGAGTATTPTRSQRSNRQNSRRRIKSIAGDADAFLLERRDRPAPDRFAEHEAR